jgi:tRNA pseudouridine38-40 synthase
MRASVRPLVGRHDFKPFQAAGAKVGTTVREIFEIELARQRIDFPVLSAGISLIRLRVVGSGFLKQMVRGIAGTALEVGRGRRESGTFAEILKSQDRKLVGVTAPAHGLWLEKVSYPDFSF